MTSLKYLAALLLIVCAAAVYYPFTQSGSLSKLENIHGIPYPLSQDSLHITEELAHADIYLASPVLAKEITLEILFVPREIKNLHVGIRENSFWLSYPKYEVYQQAAPGPNYQSQSKKITIPLTDKLADHDGSVDLMFFATDSREPTEVWWEIKSINYQVSPSWPAKGELKDFLRSQLTNEKPL